MEAKYTKGKWYINRSAATKGIARITSDTGTVAECGGWKDEQFANAERVVACVNACSGINPESVPLLVEACKKSLSCVADAGDSPAYEIVNEIVDILQKALSRAGVSE